MLTKFHDIFYCEAMEEKESGVNSWILEPVEVTLLLIKNTGVGFKCGDNKLYLLRDICYQT